MPIASNQDKYQIIVDTCCDLSPSFLEQNDIEVLHFAYVEGDDPGSPAVVDDMFATRSAHDFYDAMRNGAKPSTSQPTPAQIEEAFRKAASKGVPAVYLCFSSGISGCYETALSTAERLKGELGAGAEFYVVDTRLASTGQALLVIEAIQQRAKGLAAAELARWAEEARFFVHVIFMVDDLQALARGGRIPAAAASLGSLLSVKPLLTIDLDGKLALAAVARGRKKGMRKFVELYLKDRMEGDYGNTVVLGNADCPDDMRHLESMLRREDDSTLVVSTEIDPIIGSHVGPDMLSCVFWGADRRVTASVADRIASLVREE